jgi:release factor glutamine methyltransferase
MTIKTWLDKATKSLKKAGIETARLDALILLEDILGKDRSWLLAHDETDLDNKNIDSLKILLEQRLNQTPLAYIRKKTEFYGRNFVISHNVLVPRPESEGIIDQLKAIADDMATGIDTLRVLDVGTGSGALAITAALELKQASVDALDNDPKALKVAKSNVDLFTLNIRVFESDLLANIRDFYDVLLCNLPYVPDDYQINKAATHEPPRAIFGGHDGLDLYRKLFKQVDLLSEKPLYILCESLPGQHTALASIASLASYKLAKTYDFVQVFNLA